MKLYFVVLFLSSITSPCILGYPVGPFDLPKYWTRGVSSGGNDRSKRETLNMIPNASKDNLPSENRMEIEKSPQLPKANIDDLLRSFGIERVSRRGIIDRGFDKTRSRFETDSKNKLTPFIPFHMGSKYDSRPFIPFSKDSKHKLPPFFPISMDSKRKSQPFSKFPSGPKNTINSYTHFPLDFSNGVHPFSRSHFPSKPTQNSFYPFSIESKIPRHPFGPFEIMSQNKRSPFSPFQLRSFSNFPPRSFDNSLPSFPLTLDDSAIVIEIDNDAGSENGLDAKLQSILRKISKTKIEMKDQDEQNSSENYIEEENHNAKPCPLEGNQVMPEHGVCIMTVLGLLILIPMITTCLITKFKHVPVKKGGPVQI